VFFKLFAEGRQIQTYTASLLEGRTDKFLTQVD